MLVEFSSRSRKALMLGSAVVTAIALGIALMLFFPSQAQAQELVVGAPANAAQAPTAEQVKSAVATKAAKAKSKVHKVRTAAQWRYIGLYKGGTFKVMKNIKLPSEKYYLNISKAKKYTIDLNGKKVYTTYSGTQLRSYSALSASKGTVVLKSSKKNKGVLYSTETAAVSLSGKARFYLKSGMVYDDAVEFRSNIVSAIMLANSSRCYLQGASKVMSVGNGVSAMDNARIYATGHPYVRAGANNNTGMFTHYGSGIAITQGSNVTLSLKGGSFGTKASPDATSSTIVSSYSYTMSGNYPVLDASGRALKVAKGYKYVDAAGNKVPIKGDNMEDMFGSAWTGFIKASGADAVKRLTTTVKDSGGYYTVFVVKA